MACTANVKGLGGFLGVLDRLRRWVGLGREKPVANEEARPLGAGPRHVAVIMDGNGRWALRRGLPRTAGHRAGVEALRHASVTATHPIHSSLTHSFFSLPPRQRP